MRLPILIKSVSVFVLLVLLVAGCESKQGDLTPIYAIKGEELNFVKTVYDANDPNEVLCYKICTDGKHHTGAYLSNRVLKQIFKVEIVK